MALQENIGRDGFGNLIKQIYTTKSTAATHELIAATAGKRIKILRLDISAAGAVIATLLSSTDGMKRFDLTAENPSTNLIQADGICVAMTDVGEALQVTLSGAVAVSFYIQYVLVD